MLGESFPRALEAARGGSDPAWAGIYHDLAPSVSAYLRARGARDPEDVTGEVFLQVVQDLSRFTGNEREFRAWVFVIAHHRLLDEARWHARRPVDPTADLSTVARPGGDAEEEALENIATERVLRILATLSPDQEQVLLLRILGRLTIEEVAGIVGKTIGAVKALQRRGLRTIEREFSAEGVPL